MVFRTTVVRKFAFIPLSIELSLREFSYVLYAHTLTIMSSRALMKQKSCAVRMCNEILGRRCGIANAPVTSNNFLHQFSSASEHLRSRFYFLTTEFNFLCPLKIFERSVFSNRRSGKMQSSGCQVNYLAHFCKRKMQYHRF